MPTPEKRPMEEAGKRFPKTSWTLLAAAQHKADAREEFVQRYYRPARAYLAAILRDTGQVLESEHIEELTQGFFAEVVMTRGLLGKVDRTKGNFRPYLKQALRYYLIDWRRKQAPTPPVELHPRPDDPEGREWDIPDDAPGPEAAFHAAWVRSLIEEALHRVQAICEERE
ncbi:MAG: sigma-70 family RNA polymerase sigma factor, partial [Deltaproteobacteria bacterium]|nr:sigma-70 family RNA polymerase sigma factor [Deltaproteobacteria bacterium]